MKSLQLTIAFFLCTLTYSFSQEKALKVKFKISGGAEIECLVSDAGPLPAESGPYKVKVAGMQLKRDEGDKDLSLIFTYSIKVLPGAVPTQILIEDVTDDQAVELVRDVKPSLVKGMWMANAKPKVISKTTTPWIYSDKPTFKIYRITISSQGKQDVVLYQPSWYPVSTKQQIIELAK